MTDRAMLVKWFGEEEADRRIARMLVEGWWLCPYCGHLAWYKEVHLGFCKKNPEN